jgi:ribosomal protein L24
MEKIEEREGRLIKEGDYVYIVTGENNEKIASNDPTLKDLPVIPFSIVKRFKEKNDIDEVKVTYLYGTSAKDERGRVVFVPLNVPTITVTPIGVVETTDKVYTKEEVEKLIWKAVYKFSVAGTVPDVIVSQWIKSNLK